MSARIIYKNIRNKVRNEIGMDFNKTIVDLPSVKRSTEQEMKFTRILRGYLILKRKRKMNFD